MKDREILIEILAMKQYEHDHSSAGWPGKGMTAWRSIDAEDRQTYRDMIRDAQTPEDLYAS